MEAIISFIKEYDFLFTIVLSAIAAIYAFKSFRLAKQNDKDVIHRKIAQKQAELKALNSQHHFMDGTTMNDTMIRRSVLENEIEELEKML
ncbi:MAG: hypothetical protein K6G70_07350 [Bacteroidaceae bacterium]|nr:hypothetical protein [Bacteroidaceae bacterium]